MSTTSESELTIDEQGGSSEDTTPQSPTPTPTPTDKDKTGETFDWPEQDDFELFQRIKKALPADDNMKYDSRFNQLKWEMISFRDYSAGECKQRWFHVQAHLRRYRIADELVVDAMTWRQRPWTDINKVIKFQEHPDYPKKPCTPTMIFSSEKKSQVLETQPEMTATELTKTMEKMYNEMDDQGKQIYIEKAKKDKEQFELKLNKFMLDHPQYPARPKSAKMAVKATAPKAPTPFKLFSITKMADIHAGSRNGNEAREKCREMFRELDDNQRLEWIYKSLEREKQYNEDLENFKMEHPEVEVGPKKSLLSKEERHIKDKNEGKPDKPPNSGYSLYSKKMLVSATVKHLDTKERMAEISRLWKALQEEERKTYNDEAQQLNVTYRVQLASYLGSLPAGQQLLEPKKSSPKRPLGNPEHSEEKKIKVEGDESIDELESQKTIVKFSFPSKSRPKMAT